MYVPVVKPSAKILAFSKQCFVAIKMKIETFCICRVILVVVAQMRAFSYHLWSVTDWFNPMGFIKMD